jgi:hypothetical protein
MTLPSLSTRVGESLLEVWLSLVASTPATTMHRNKPRKKKLSTDMTVIIFLRRALSSLPLRMTLPI